MRMNALIPMSGQGVDIVDTLQRSGRAGREAGLNNLFRQQGDAIARGDQNALAQLARFDPQAAMGIEDTMRNRAVQDRRMQILNAEEKRRVEAAAANLEQAELEREIAETEASMTRAAQFYTQGNLPALNELLVSEGEQPVETLEQAQGMLARYDEAYNVMKRVADMRQTGGDSAREQEIRRIMTDQGFDRPTAQALADGLITTSRDPITGEAQIVDMREFVRDRDAPNQIPGQNDGAGTTSNATTEPQADGGNAVPAEGVDFRGAMGIGGAVKAGVDLITDAAFGRRVFNEESRARTALQNVRTRTLTTLAAASVAGRPSNYLMEMFNQNVVQPGVLSGPEGALDTAEQTLSFLDAMIAENRSVLQSRTTPQLRTEAQRNIQALGGLRRDYEIVVNGLRSGGSVPDDNPFSNMSREEVLNADVLNMSAEELDAWNQAVDAMQ